jgi:hypothetical protein
MDKINILQSLLSQISLIDEKYKNINKVSGDNFNIFSILKLEYNEVNLHSIFISELINPKGSHDFGKTFFKLFIDLVLDKLKSINVSFEMDYSNIIKKIENSYNSIISTQYEAKTEEFFDFTSKEDTISGRIDIVIKNNIGDAIIIENKINAKDQKKQLIRYSKRYPNSPILYLTLNEDRPSKLSNSEIKNNNYYELIEGKDFVCISYKKDILMWVEKCMKEAVNYPILRETLKQYLNLIKHLTNQNTNIIMKEEIFNLFVNNPKSIDSALLLEKNMPYIKEKIIEKVSEKIINRFNEIELAFNTSYDDGFVHQIEKCNFQIFSYFEGETLYLGFIKKNKSSDYTNNNDVFIKLLQKYSNKVIDNSNREDGWIYCNLKAWQNSSWSDRYVNFPQEYFGIIKDICQTIIDENIDMTK